MKKILILGVFAILSIHSSARAEEIDTSARHDHRLYRYDFSCRFKEPDDRCTAFARVFAYADHDRDHTFENANNYPLLPLMAVRCDGELIYADGARLLSGRRHVVIASATSNTPAIMIDRDDDDALKPNWMRYDATLQLHRDRIEGHCEVRAVPVHHNREEIADSAPQSLH